jgi:hypothetical protein
MKKLLRAGFVGILLILMALPVFAAGTVTVSPFYNQETDLYIVSVSWTAGAGGAVTPVAFPGPLSANLQGRYIVEVITIPGAGAAAPTDQYDVTLIEPYTTDVMGGTLLNRSDTATERARPLPDPTKYSGLIPGVLTFTLINNTNASATGMAVLFISK